MRSQNQIIESLKCHKFLQLQITNERFSIHLNSLYTLHKHWSGVLGVVSYCIRHNNTTDYTYDEYQFLIYIYKKPNILCWTAIFIVTAITRRFVKPRDRPTGRWCECVVNIYATWDRFGVNKNIMLLHNLHNKILKKEIIKTWKLI